MNSLKHRRIWASSALSMLAFGLACAAPPAFAINYDGSLDTSLSPLPLVGIPGLFRYRVLVGGGGAGTYDVSILEATATRLASVTADASDDAGCEVGVSEPGIR